MRMEFDGACVHVRSCDVSEIVSRGMFFAFVGHDVLGDMLLIPMSNDERWEEYNTMKRGET